ncbi:putative FYVE zinc finger, Zinc finger, FYVE/PHD-type, Zinc finger, RING/FYVE/PHD-type [Plasmopara halstedii]
MKKLTRKENNKTTTRGIMSTSVHLLHDRMQTRKMHHRAMRQITDVLGVCLNSTRRKEQWTCLRRDKHQELYAKRISQGVNNGSSVYYLAVNEASCGFDEAFNLLHFDSTAQFRLMMKLLHGRDFKDGTLHSMRTKENSTSDWTVDTQHAAVSIVYQDHRKSVLLREQHLTFFQTLKIFLPENQRQHTSEGTVSTSVASSLAGLSARPSDEVHKRTIAFSWLPIPQSHDVMLETAHQVDLQYTLIVEEVSSNRLRLSCVTSSYHDENDGPLSCSPRGARAIARRLALCSVGRFELAVAASRVGVYKFVSPHHWVKNEERAYCVICWKRFNAIFRRRHHCRLCGEVICGSCSSLRSASIVNTKLKEVNKTRMCHLCHNKTRYQANTHGVSDQTNKDDTHVSLSKWKPPPRESGFHLEGENLMQDLPASLKIVGGQELIMPAPLDASTSQECKASEDALGFNCVESGGYIGALPSHVTPSINSKIISIKSIARSAKISLRKTPNKADIRSCQEYEVNSAKLSIDVFSWESENLSGIEDTHAGYGQPRSGIEVSRSFLHPVAMTSKLEKMVQPIRLNAESSSCSSADRSFLSSCLQMDSKEQEDQYMGRFDYRRTSMMSSNLGLLDQDLIADENYFLPKLEGHREEERLKLMEVIISPACTLVDRTLMHRSCELAAVAFGVKAAFIARVDDEYILIEHAVGTRDLLPQDEILRRESLCDFVLCQPRYQPWVVLDCLVDSRTREIPMVQHLRIRFFIGISVCVRGLPIACLCAFGQDSDEQSDEHNEIRASLYDTSVLQYAAQQMEDELENLLHGLEV